LGGLSIMAHVERPIVERPILESRLTLLRLLMVGMAVVILLVCAAALLGAVEFVYRYLIAAPIACLLTCLGRISASWRSFSWRS
jgi:hypothetical protein